MHPFVALMRRYCIDYTNSHDQSVCDDIMEPEYVVHMSGYELGRDEVYKPAVAALFDRAPGLGLLVHELVLNGDRLCMRFSEHAAMAGDAGSGLACWPGIGLYRWNGRRLVENWVEQDHLSMQRQLVTGKPDVLEPPHLDPWVMTQPVEPDQEAEDTVRRWLLDHDISDAARVHVDDTPPGEPWAPCVERDKLVIDDLFSAGPRVPFHITVTGPYAGGIDGVPDAHRGDPVSVHIAGIATVSEHGSVEEVRAVTSRAAVRHQLTGASPI